MNDVSMKNDNGAIANSSNSNGGMIYNNNIVNSSVQPPLETIRDADPQKPRIIIQEIGSSGTTNSTINGGKTGDDPKAKRKTDKVSKNGAAKGHWNLEEDRMLIEYVDKFGKNKWSQIARMMPGRLGKDTIII